MVQPLPRTVRVLMWDITSAWADFLFNLSNIILLIGALAVLLGTFGSIKMGAVREQFANERISANEAETARSIAESDKAKVAALTAQLELEKFKAPRSLTNDQLTRLRERLRPFAGQQFGMITYWNVKEPTDFTKQLGEDALIAAGWKFIKSETFEALVGVVTGIEVELGDNSDKSAKQAARELALALAAEGFTATIRNEPRYTKLIKIQIGMKP